MTVAPDKRKDLRRSTRVPIQVRIDVQATGLSCDGETVVVNMHGALLRTTQQLQSGDRVTLHVHLTGKSAGARVVFADRTQALHFGIALDKPENIWGIPLPPSDWDTRASDFEE
jgi:hypothetical protein